MSSEGGKEHQPQDCSDNWNLLPSNLQCVLPWMSAPKEFKPYVKHLTERVTGWEGIRESGGPRLLLGLGICGQTVGQSNI